MSSSSLVLLSISQIGRQIQQRWIWQSVSFELLAGERVAVVGPSGAGKSLLLRAIAGLDPIQAGQIYFESKPLTDWAMPSYRTQVIYLHQRPALLEGSVKDNLQAVFRFASHRQRAYSQERILGYLEMLGRSPDFLERPISALSGGESQIVAFLRVLQLSPQVLLLDEPTASLDPEAVRQFEALVEAWRSEDPRRAYLWTSHDPSQLGRMSDRKVEL